MAASPEAAVLLSHVLPVLFLSHGSPLLVLSPEEDVHKYLTNQLVASLEDVWADVKAIVTVSAHNESKEGHVTVSTGDGVLENIHDFYGFPKELYEVSYPARGSNAVSQRVLGLLKDAGIDAAPTSRGLDHGAWSILKMMLPDAPLPVVDVSLRAGQSADFHTSLGKALEPLRAEGVLIIGSGQPSHNLQLDGGRARAGRTSTPEPLVEFVTNLRSLLTNKTGDERSNAIAEVVDNKRPLYLRNHPTDDHFMPLVVAAAAGGASQCTLAFDGLGLSSGLPSDCYRFG
mmetsp:Transcript_19705/g.75580  ORF Transcript_19705/g.75580 Transcript_19705/m.75580 type:complete len:287 (+) Transcript_19705:276-1136(+)